MIQQFNRAVYKYNCELHKRKVYAIYFVLYSLDDIT